MKFLSGRAFCRTISRASGCLLAAAIMPAWAATELSFWHSLSGHNAAALQDLVSAYNRSQPDVKLQLKAFDSPEALDQALAAGASANKLPAMAQLGDNHSLDEIAARKYVQPLYAMQKSSALKDVQWFVAPDNAFIHDAKGRLMAFPFMLEVPVMFYNQDAFKKAGLVPAQPQRVWMDLQGQLVSMANNGSRKCPLTSDLAVSINLENLAAVNNQLFASADNGLKAKGLPSFSFDSTYVRHLSLMISWVRSEIMVRPDAGMHSIERFAKGECAVLLSNSSHIGGFSAQNTLNYAVSGLPYYPEVTQSPGSPFVSGSAIWLMKSDAKQSTASAGFLAWLAQAPQASAWYQKTGFLPLTKAAFEQTPPAYYAKLGQWRDLVAAYGKKSALTAQGFRINNYPAIRARFQQILDTALSGQQPAVTALQLAATEGNRLMRQ